LNNVHPVVPFAFILLVAALIVWGVAKLVI
jgi:hypothetical protein